MERDRVSDAGFLQSEAIVGAQLKYRWKELEPDRDRYERRLNWHESTNG